MNHRGIALFYLLLVCLMVGVANASTEYTYGSCTALISGTCGSAFDDNLATRFDGWHTYYPPGNWILQDYGNGVSHVINNITITASEYGSYTPTEWNFSGSNDDSTYIQFDSQTGISWSDYEIKKFAFSNTNAYRYYRFWILAGDVQPLITELKFYYDPPPPDTTPPASITDLTNVTTCENITFQWTNPTDADFNHTMVWKNNVFQYNLTNVTTSDLWESLVENTAYTFSSKTVDITGNANTTFVNLTSTTDTCPVPTTEPTTTATTAPPTTTTVSPTPTPTPTPLVGCTYFNLTGVTFGENSTDWNATEGLNTWGVSTFNATQGNVSWWICRATPITTAPPTWQPLINPSTDIKTDWLAFLWQWWWPPILILIMILLFRRQ